jgi:1-acyl-sn-glycerol-3-phosphate acyltransferase
MIRKICAFIFFKLMGWKLVGDHRKDIKKKLLIVIPHTSNWDFPVGLLARSVMNDKIKFVGKQSLFKAPYGFIFRALGGIPVNRNQSSNFVDAVVDMYNDADELNIVLAPEGTRSKVEKLKTGFYFIAFKANVPIIMVKFDYKDKAVSFAEPFMASGDYEKDFHVLKKFYSGSVGKNPSWGYFNS